MRNDLVWYALQKFNVHRRLRPEAVGGLIHRHLSSIGKGAVEYPELGDLVNALRPILDRVEMHNAEQNRAPDRRRDPSARHASYLLPMAFPEGSPMHPSYGAGHATVAGACATILKAVFDSDAVLEKAYQLSSDGNTLEEVDLPQKLSVGGELNKLVENISIGRNWAGVHFYTDYYESIFLGEKIALGILEEQKLTFGETYSMTLQTFDGRTVRI